MKSKMSPVTAAAVAVAVVAVLLAIAAWMRPPVSSEQAPAGGAATSSEGTAPTKTSTGSSLGLSYNEAIDLYGMYRFQFTECHGNPGTISLAAGTTFLLDNRDAEAHTIMVGTQSYAVGAYGFRIASVAKKGEYQITCDGGGAATLNVE